jgi:integrase
VAVQKLTKRIVEAIRPEPQSEVVVWDAVLPGFGVRVKPSGVRSYIVQYRNEHGRSKRGTIGSHGRLTLDQARRQARQLLASVVAGADPVAERKAMREAPTMNDLLDRYITDHLEPHNKARTQEEFKRIVRKHIRPSMGAMKAAGVTRQDVAKLHKALDDTPRMANTVLSVLSKMFNLAEVWGMRPDGSNPVRLIKRYPENRRERFCTDSELGQLGVALSQAEQQQTEPQSVLDAIRLLALTGCRLSEVIRLRWADVDLESHKLAIRDGKAGGRWQTVGAETVAFLSGMSRVEGSPWVLPHTDPAKHLPDYTLKKAWRRIRARASLGDVRLHDLRHTVGTYAGQTGANAFLIRDKLGHRSTAMTGQYVNHSHDPVRQLSDQVEGRIVAAMRGSDGATVAWLRGK